MKQRSLFLTLLASVMLVGVLTTSCSDPEAEAAAIRANDIADCQNLMSAHAWYHSSFLNDVEIAKLWVSPDGEYASTAVWAQNTNYWIGMDNISGYYGTNTPHENTKSQFQVHTITTGVVEIADDRKTAKGVWYTPGIIGGANSLTGIWERYGMDFVLEDGEWKIWHCHVYTDFTIKTEQSSGMGGGAPSGDQGGAPEMGGTPPVGMEGAPEMGGTPPDGMGGAPGGAPGGGGQAEQIGSAVATSGGAAGSMGVQASVTVENGYKELASDVYPDLIPRLPEPYATFDDTWSYGDPDEVEMFSGAYREWSEIKAEYGK